MPFSGIIGEKSSNLEHLLLHRQDLHHMVLDLQRLKAGDFHRLRNVRFDTRRLQIVLQQRKEFPT